MTPARITGVLIRIAILGVFVLAAWRAVLLSWSDLEGRKGTPSGLRKAEAIMPSNGRVHFLNALAIEQSDPLSPAIGQEFAAAVKDNPRYSDALLAWSVDTELHGDKAGAEQLLLRAQSVDHLIRPAWALANFYFRENQPELFWPQARECLRMIGVTGLAIGRFEPTPIYQLCWQMTSDPQLILSRAIPDDRVIRDHYFLFLVATGRLEAAKAVLNLNLPGANGGEVNFYLSFMRTLIDRGDLPFAIETWKRLHEEKLIAYPGPDPSAGVFLTNGDFAGVPLKQAFDWRFGFPDSVHFTYEPEHVFRFDFDGKEPESFLVMTQLVPMTPGKNYRFTARYKSEFDPEMSGLRWTVNDRTTQKPIPMQVSVSGTGEEKTLTGTFRVPADVNCVNLTLGYQRELGTTLVRGSLELLNTSIRLQ